MGSSLLLHEYKIVLGKSLHIYLKSPPPKTCPKMPNNSKEPNLNYLQTKEMQAEVEIGQQRSARQFASRYIKPPAHDHPCLLQGCQKNDCGKPKT